MSTLLLLAMLAIVVTAFGTGWRARGYKQIDYKRRWKNANELLVKAYEDKGLAKEEEYRVGNGWKMEGVIEDVILLEGEDKGKRASATVIYLFKGQKRVHVPRGNGHYGLLMDADNFREKMDAYQERAIEIAEAIT